MLNSNGHVMIPINYACVISVYLLECKEGKGVNYRGTEAKTQKGVLCQKWADSIPHKPKYGLFIFVFSCFSEMLLSHLYVLSSLISNAFGVQVFIK